ncbi:hypothetical protein GCM10011380_19630 [Sphingomonas metalli]|uniref:Aspartyl protease n=1 Tax=Sphingomonas metalli TaxID=1779358 RepID=A0A916T562_9SPHN|nr:hypothetical protein [Sphingomonas metalli]GGB30224.1 hypothetical protein GCM10011380_19630 [Sphingomonas metalli]
MLNTAVAVALMLATGSTPAPSPPAAVTLAAASASLAGRPQCVAFTWLPNEKGSPRGGISVPVRINGRDLPLQLDTGANVTSLYGGFPITAGWAAKGSETFRARTFELAGTTLDRAQVYLNPDMEEDATLRGTLGLPALMGRIAVIDYPEQRFCLFAEPDLPAPIQQARYVRAMLRNAKFHVPIRTGAFTSDTIVFDTGSSEMPLHVDLAAWKRITGRAATAGAPATIQGTAWGKPFTLAGAPAATPVMVGELPLGTISVFTNPDAPESFADWPVPTDGVLGNAALWDGIVILDLTARMRFGVIR